MYKSFEYLTKFDKKIITIKEANFTNIQRILGIQDCQSCPAGHEIIAQLNLIGQLSRRSTSQTVNLKLPLFGKIRLTLQTLNLKLS